MGGTHSRECNQITKETILWCKNRNISLTITHLPDVDLFASQLNAKLTCYVAWKPDPNAYAIVVFTLNWSAFTRILLFPFQCYRKSTSEDNPVPNNCHTSSSRLANTVLVLSSDINATCSPSANKSSDGYTDSAAQCTQSSPVLPQPPVD